MRLPRLYPIVDTDTLARLGLPLDRFVEELLAGGAEILQLRTKNGTAAEISEQAQVISFLTAGRGCLPVMNDRADLAALAGWRAVHVGHRDLPPDAVRSVLGEAGVVGVSTHHPEQAAAADRSTADYLAIGPVFNTRSKQDTEPVVGLEGVRAARAATRKPLVAIGGITLQNAPAIIDAGADAVAVIGALFATGKSTEAVVRDFLTALR